MSEDQQNDEFTKKVNQIINVPQQTVQQPVQMQPTLNISFDKSFNFQNCNSLALVVRQSIQNGIPIPFNMLSRSEDAFQLQNRQYQQNQFDNGLKTDQAQNGFISQLGLEELISDQREKPATSQTAAENTKNVLRNLGNAQNHYILYHKKARKYIEENVSNSKQFDKWVRNAKLQKFEHYKGVWGGEEDEAMKRVYKHLSWQFYCEQAIPYILSSRIKKMETRASHLKHLYRFLEGIKDPESFTYFKKT